MPRDGRTRTRPYLTAVARRPPTIRSRGRASCRGTGVRTTLDRVYAEGPAPCTRSMRVGAKGGARGAERLFRAQRPPGTRRSTSPAAEGLARGDRRARAARDDPPYQAYMGTQGALQGGSIAHRLMHALGASELTFSDDLRDRRDRRRRRDPRRLAGGRTTEQWPHAPATCSCGGWNPALDRPPHLWRKLLEARWRAGADELVRSFFRALVPPHGRRSADEHLPRAAARGHRRSALALGDDARDRRRAGPRRTRRECRDTRTATTTCWSDLGRAGRSRRWAAVGLEAEAIRRVRLRLPQRTVSRRCCDYGVGAQRHLGAARGRLPARFKTCLVPAPSVLAR